MPLRLAARANLALRVQDAARRCGPSRELEALVESLAAETAASETYLDYDDALSEAREWAAVVLSRTACRVH